VWYFGCREHSFLKDIIVERLEKKGNPFAVSGKIPVWM
jgi:hypothetical protein